MLTKSLESCAALIAIMSWGVGCASSTADDAPSTSASGQGGASVSSGSTGGGGTAGSGGEGGGVGGMGGATPMCSEDPCKLTSPQCGCSDGEMCTLRMGERTCGPAGTAQLGEPCSATHWCAPGGLCFGLGSNVQGLCRAFCDDDTDCASSPGAGCALRIGTSGGGVAEDRVCSEACHIVTNDGCPVEGTKCVAITSTNTACGTAGTGALGDTCTAGFDCQVGLACAPSPTQPNAHECMQVTTMSNPQCPQGTAPQNAGVTIGSVTYLVCVPQS